MPGPTSTWDQNHEVNDGTMCRMVSKPPGPNERRFPSAWARGEALWEAYERYLVLVPAAVYRTTGYALGELLKSLLPGMAQMLIVLGASTALGATAGGVIGFFFGGAGAAPGAVLGGELGFEIGTAILTWMGVAFLAKAIVQGLGQVWANVSQGITIARAAPEFPAKDYPKQIEQAAQELANAVGVLVLVILQAIVAWVFAKAGIRATKAAVATGESMTALGSQAAADEAVGALVEQLRGSRLGPRFPDWVERNWPRLRDDPKLRFKTRPPTNSGIGESPALPKEETPTEPSISEQSTAKKGVFGEHYADKYMKDQGFDKLNGEPTQIADSPKGRGIDGVYKNANPPPQYVIGEAKYGTSRLGETQSGKQMSPEWIDQRLDKAVGKRIADQIREADLEPGQVERWLLRVDENGNVTRTTLKDGEP